tara:strand:- start:9042 stop:9500 length:459 start_codon:yes stop_codon:yes gene_type:complete
VAKNETYINKKEAIELGLPDIRGTFNEKGKQFLHYAMSRATGRVRAVYENPAFRKSQSRLRRRKRKKLQSFTSRVKMRFGCRQCGYKKHPAALHFNHLDQEIKCKEVSKIHTWVKLKIEMRKCEILCANCHAIHTVENKHHLKFNHTKHGET